MRKSLRIIGQLISWDYREKRYNAYMEHALQDGKGGKWTSAKKKKEMHKWTAGAANTQKGQRRAKKILEPCRALGSWTTGSQMFIKDGNTLDGDDVLQCMSNIVSNNFTKKKKAVYNQISKKKKSEHSKLKGRVDWPKKLSFYFITKE